MLFWGVMLEQVALAVRARWGGIGSDFFFLALKVGGRVEVFHGLV